MEDLPWLCSAAIRSLQDESVSRITRGPPAVSVFIRREKKVDVQSSLRSLGDGGVRLCPYWGCSGSACPLEASDGSSHQSLTREEGAIDQAISKTYFVSITFRVDYLDRQIYLSKWCHSRNSLKTSPPRKDFCPTLRLFFFQKREKTSPSLIKLQPSPHLKPLPPPYFLVCYFESDVHLIWNPLSILRGVENTFLGGQRDDGWVTFQGWSVSELFRCWARLWPTYSMSKADPETSHYEVSGSLTATHW